MQQTPDNSPSPSRFRRLRWVLASAALFAALLLVTGLFRRGASDPLLDQPSAPVSRGPLTISVVESGAIRPRQQIILKNEMDDPSTIVFLVKEGTLVKKGDLLVELDSTIFDTELVERRIRVQNGEAALIYAQENFGVVTNQAQADIDQAQLEHEFARQDLEKYQKGEYPKQIKELDAKITLAEEELGRAEEDLRWSNVLFKEKYLSQSELQQDELAARKAQLNLELAREELGLTRNYTHQRQLAQLTSNLKQTGMALERARRKASANIAQARAELRAREAGLEEEKARLRRVQSEIAKARITAPIDGMALYASSVSNDWDDDEDRIQEGATVDERGEIIYLPTADSFNVDVRIPEVSLSKLRRGLPVRVIADALPGRTFAGRVENIAPLPDSSSRFLNPNLKLYNTIIELEATDPALRNGMSCQVEIIVEEFADAVYIPIQAVVRQNGQAMAYRMDGGLVIPTPIQLGLDNHRVVQILKGLEAGQAVSLTPPLTVPSGATGPGRETSPVQASTASTVSLR